MAAGQTHIIAKYVYNMTLTGLPDLWATDTMFLALINSTTTPNVNDSDPRWGAGGAQNYSTNEVSGGNYVAGGVQLTGLTVTFAGAAPQVALNANSPVAWAANAANPTNARWAVVYDSTDAGKRVLGFIDLGAVITLVPGYQINFNNVNSGVQPVFQGTAN